MSCTWADAIVEHATWADVVAQNATWTELLICSTDRDVDTAGWLDPPRWAATLLPSPHAAELGPRRDRVRGRLIGSGRAGSLGPQRWRGTT